MGNQSFFFSPASMETNGVIFAAIMNMRIRHLILMLPLLITACKMPQKKADVTDISFYYIPEVNLGIGVYSNETEQTVILEYHTDNTVLLTMEDDPSNMYMVFVTEENLSSGPSIFDMMQENAEEQVEKAEMTEEEAEAAFAELFAQLEAEGVLEENKDFDLNALLSELNLEGLLDNVNVEELKAKFTNENGEFDLNGLLESVDVQGLAGKLFGGSEDGEGSVDLAGMLEGIFGSEAE